MSCPLPSSRRFGLGLPLSEKTGSQKQEESRQKHWSREHHAHGQPTLKQKSQLNIGLAEEFREHAGQCISGKKRPGRKPRQCQADRVIGEEAQDREENEALKTGFVNLARVTRPGISSPMARLSLAPRVPR